jgi:hypothetical protein
MRLLKSDSSFSSVCAKRPKTGPHPNRDEWTEGRRDGLTPTKKVVVHPERTQIWTLFARAGVSVIFEKRGPVKRRLGNGVTRNALATFIILRI